MTRMGEAVELGALGAPLLDDGRHVVHGHGSTLSSVEDNVSSMEGKSPGLDIALTAVPPVIWGSTYAVTQLWLPPDRPFFAAAARVLPAGLLLLMWVRRVPKGRWWGRAALLGSAQPRAVLRPALRRGFPAAERPGIHAHGALAFGVVSLTTLGVQRRASVAICSASALSWALALPTGPTTITTFALEAGGGRGRSRGEREQQCGGEGGGPGSAQGWDSGRCIGWGPFHPHPTAPLGTTAAWSRPDPARSSCRACGPAGDPPPWGS